ncbi:TonB-dependent receptor [Chiayiivirga flava]|uniref:Catecholate siderophore receptor n=1 Tax=Chiayiivirga flava TaxID=659595 RepID=A0A7W8D739_9GAMM|nr:TonB-dependent siderophore receptor [Chiayiivirga flava]MBB5209125.1 catecholate siderophore receptor [Chiayiivirga flava]
MTSCTSLPRPALLALAVSSALCLMAPPSHAAAVADAGAPARADARTLDEMVVEGRSVPKAASPKYTQPLLDTPQSITQVPTEVIEGQNLLGLRDILSTLPGITFGAGEGGGGYGDSINLRGFSANNDITVDGIRDSAQYTRSDTFNLETVEVINGANSVNSGAGAVGGTINLVSKVANDQDFTRAQLGAGTDSYGRATVDSNTTFGENSAFRINAMWHRNDIPGRDVEENERWGIAPSVAFGLGTDTVVSLSYLHQEDDNIPQYGVPYFPGIGNGGPLPGVDPSDYFGYRNIDTQEIEVDAFTAKINHSFSENFSVSNVTRQSTTTQFSRVNPPQGTWCLDSGINPANGSTCDAPGTYQPSGPRGNTRDSENQIAINQTDFLSTFRTGGIEHDLVTGFSISHETYDLRSGSSLRNADGTTVPYPVMDLHDPDSIWTGPVNFIQTAKQAGELDNRALYALDTMKFSDALHLNLGVRYERNEGTHRSDTIAIPADGGTVTPGVEAQNNDDLLSYRGGLVFKPAENGTIYLSYGNSETPSKASVNGACSATTCNVDPESAVITELGTKWDLYDGALSLTAAVFRNERENYKVQDNNNPDNPSQEQQLDGSARVDGLLLGAVGRISENWYVYANYARLESEVLQGVSDNDAALGSDFARGDRLTNTPEDSASLWTTYDLSSQWQVGYGVTYLGKVWLTQHNADNPDGPLVTAPGYTVHRAMVNWRATQQLSLQLNATNLFDKEYYTRPRNNGWSTPGEARSVVLTASYNF